jgi:cytochrome c peroxidase
MRLAVLMLLAGLWARLPAAPQAVAPAELSADALARLSEFSPLPPVPDDPTNAFDDDPAAAHLGRFLFFDERLSGSGDVSCATCHVPEKSWTDGRQLARVERELERHTMSLWNVAHNRWFFWDGRKDSLWSQALAPLEDEREHAGSRLQYAHLIHGDAALRAAYEGVFGPLPALDDAARFPPEGRPVPGDPQHPHALAWAGLASADQDAVNRVFANLGKALAAFERQLVTSRAPFDVFVEGVREGDALKQRALSAPARRGLELFLGKARCHVCHAGPNFTDLEFHNDRVPPNEGGTSLDQGRFKGIEEVTADPFNGVGPYSDGADDEEARAKVGYLLRSGHNFGEFKTPSLRNVALTAPYMHQGQFATLQEVVHYYSTLEDALPLHHSVDKLLVPLGLTTEESADLVAFLESLTDASLDPQLFTPPETPGLLLPATGERE